jgi:hypothetical protein
MRKARQLEARHCPPIANIRKSTEAENTTAPPAFRIGVVRWRFSFSSVSAEKQLSSYRKFVRKVKF